jgi:hypothetical protein
MYVCLAAGKGKGMMPLTSYVHKAMIPFFGVPLLAYSILSIPENSEVVIVVNYLAEQITNYFGHYYHGRTIRYLKQTDPTGSGDALVQFSQHFAPREPVITWMADQLMFSDEVAILSQSEANAAIYAGAEGEGRDIGLWKISPATLPRLRSCFERGEYRALPALEKEGLRKIRVLREKLEISFPEWDKIQETCNQLKQEYRIEYRWSVDSPTSRNTTLSSADRLSVA